MPYTTYETNLTPGRAGDSFDDACASDDISLIAADPQAAQVETVTVDNAVNATTYTFSINGVSVSYLSDATATKDEIRLGLIAAIQDDPAISGLVIGDASGADALTITSVQPGLAFTFAESDANLSSVATTASASANAIPFGRGIMRDLSNVQGGKLIAAGDFTASTAVFTPTVANTTLYSIVAKVDDDIHTINFTSGGAATAKTIVEGLLAAFALLTTSNVSATENDVVFTLSSVNGSALSIENSTANLALVFTRGDELASMLAGILLREDTQDPSQLGGVDGMAPNSTLSVRRLGRLRVATEDSAAPGSNVYMRVAANGSNTTIGICRATADDGAVLLPAASWYKNESAAMAVVQL